MNTPLTCLGDKADMPFAAAARKIAMRAAGKAGPLWGRPAWLQASLATMALLAAMPAASAQDLRSFGVIGPTVTNTGITIIDGNVAVGGALTGFPPGIVRAPYTLYVADAVAQQAQSDLATAYNLLSSRPATANLTGVDLGGQTLTPGVYNFDTSAQLTGAVTLDAANNPDAVFIFNIGSTLTTASTSSVQLINGARAGNVFFRVGSSATLGSGTAFQGQILALASITLVTGATVNCGAVMARTGAVTLDTNVINICPLDTAPLEDILDGGVVVPGTPVGPGTPGVVPPPPATAVEVAAAIDSYRDATGALPLAFGVLALLTPSELVLALDQMSGEIGSAAAPSAFQSTNSFLDMALSQRPTFDRAPQPAGRRDVPYGQAGSPSPADRGTVSALGYFPTSHQPSALDAFDNGTLPYATPDWALWGGGYGGYSRTEGNAAQGTSERTIRDFGFAAGVDFRLLPDTTVGFSAGIGGTDFSLSDGLSSGHSQDFQAAVFGSTRFEAAYVSGALAYGYHATETERTLTFAGIDRFASEFGSHTVSGEVEVGYNLGLFTPYAAVRAQGYMAPGYSETVNSGSSIFALDYDAQDVASVRIEIGTHLSWTTDLTDDKQLTLHSKIGWAHDEVSGDALTASFQSLPGPAFAVAGAGGDADSLLVSLGADLAVDNGFSLAATVDGAFTTNSQSYAGKVKLGYSF